MGVIAIFAAYLIAETYSLLKKYEQKRTQNYFKIFTDIDIYCPILLSNVQ